MIALREDCFLVAKDDGNFIPCSIEDLTLEIAGGAADQVDREWLSQAAAGVIHYFKHELGKEQVTPEEFAAALSKVLQGFGLVAEISAEKTTLVNRRVLMADLRKIACDAGKLGELEFFRLLQERFSEIVAEGPDTMEFFGLRGCVKQLTGRKHWCHVCAEYQAEIVERLRCWYGQQAQAVKASLVVH